MTDLRLTTAATVPTGTLIRLPAAFAFPLSALKALLAHEVVLTTVLDAHPGKPPS